MVFKLFFKIRRLSIVYEIIVIFNKFRGITKTLSVILWCFVGYARKIIVKTCIHLCPSPTFTGIRKDVVMLVTFLNRIFIDRPVLSKMRIRHSAYINYQSLRDPNGLFVSCVTCDNVSLSEIHDNICCSHQWNRTTD